MVLPGQRPTPLRDVARDVNATLGIASAILTALVGYGLLTVAQKDAIAGLLGLIPGALTGMSVMWATLRAAQRGEQLVTPLSSPQDAGGRPLVAEPEPGRHASS